MSRLALSLALILAPVAVFAGTPVAPVSAGTDIDPAVRLAARNLSRPLVPAGAMPLRSAQTRPNRQADAGSVAANAVAVEVPWVAAAAAVNAEASVDAPQDLQNIVRACGGDPVRLFDFVRNEIAHQPYRGFRKRPELTWQTRSGNSADQAWLLVALLRTAGYPAMFEFGSVYMPIPDACSWLGVDNVDALLNLAGAAGWRCGQVWQDYFAIEEVWAVVQINGSWYRWVPGFKRMNEVHGVDLGQLSGYDRPMLLGAAGGTETTLAVSGVSEPGVFGYLGDRATQLRTGLRENHPNSSTEELLGGYRVVPANMPAPTHGWPECWEFYPGEDGSFFTNQYEPVVVDHGDGTSSTYDFTDTVTIWFGLPSADNSFVSQYLVSLNAPLASLAGREVTVGPGPDYRAQIRVDGEVLFEASNAYLGPLGIEYFIDHKTVRPDQSDYSRFQTAKYDGRYSLVIGVGGYQNGALYERQSRRVEELTRSGYAADSTERVDASLTKLGLDYLRQLYRAEDLASRMNLKTAVRGEVAEGKAMR